MVEQAHPINEEFPNETVEEYAARISAPPVAAADEPAPEPVVEAPVVPARPARNEAAKADEQAAPPAGGNG